MAKANLADLIGSSSNDVSAVPAKPEARPTAASKPAPAPTSADSADDVRINFMIPRELRQKFKAWAAQNDTSIKDELTRHIRSLVD